MIGAIISGIGIAAIIILIAINTKEMDSIEAMPHIGYGVVGVCLLLSIGVFAYGADKDNKERTEFLNAQKIAVITQEGKSIEIEIQKIEELHEGTYTITSATGKVYEVPKENCVLIDDEGELPTYSGTYYCPDCGEDLSSNKCCKNKTTVNSGYCTDCGAKISNTHNFCSGCGKDLKK